MCLLNRNASRSSVKYAHTRFRPAVSDLGSIMPILFSRTQDYKLRRVIFCFSLFPRLPRFWALGKALWPTQLHSIITLTHGEMRYISRLRKQFREAKKLSHTATGSQSGFPPVAFVWCRITNSAPPFIIPLVIVSSQPVIWRLRKDSITHAAQSRPFSQGFCKVVSEHTKGLLKPPSQ